jgi:hypothetical protein
MTHQNELDLIRYQETRETKETKETKKYERNEGSKLITMMINDSYEALS